MSIARATAFVVENKRKLLFWGGIILVYNVVKFSLLWHAGTYLWDLVRGST